MYPKVGNNSNQNKDKFPAYLFLFSRDFLGNQTEQNPKTDLVEAAGVLFHFSLLAVLTDLSQENSKRVNHKVFTKKMKNKIIK